MQKPRRHQIRCFISTAAALAASAVWARRASAIVPQFTIADLGTLGGTRSEADGINNVGQVTGWSVAADGSDRAFITAANSPINPATDMVGTLTGGTANYAYAINSSGQICGNDTISSGDLAYRYSSGVATALPTLGGTWSYTYAINDSGQVVGGAATGKQGNNFPTHAVLYNGTTAKDLGTLGGQDSYGYAIDSNGDVAGYTQMNTVSGTTPEHAFLWKPTTPNSQTGTMTDINPWTGNYSYAFGMNDAGQIVGGATTDSTDATYHAFLRNPGATPTIVDLQTLGGPSSEAHAINELGIVVGNADTSSGSSDAFVYIDGQMHDLNTLLGGSGWQLTKATAINDATQIVGVGTNSNGQQHAYLISPVPTWRVDSNGTWSGATDWYGQIPSAAGAEVQFTGAISATRTVTLDTARTVGHVVFDSSHSYILAGPGQLSIDGTNPDKGIEVRSGSHTISAPVNFVSGGTISLAASTQLAISGTITGAIDDLSMGSLSTLDLAKNKLTINYTQAQGSPLSSLINSIKTGRNGGLWNGPGITSSAAASIAANSADIHKTALGYSQTASTVTIGYTLLGDADMNGTVNSADFALLAAHFGSTSGFWFNGDFNYDGTVNALDFNAIATNYGKVISSQPADLPSNVLVPEANMILLIGALSCFSFQRYRTPSHTGDGSTFKRLELRRVNAPGF